MKSGFFSGKAQHGFGENKITPFVSGAGQVVKSEDDKRSVQAARREPGGWQKPGCLFANPYLVRAGGYPLW